MDITLVTYPSPSQMLRRQLHQITDEIIHHSAGSPYQTPLEIDAEHRARGMAMIGYNFVIGLDGTVYGGRPLDCVPAASYGRNTESLNICVLGNFELDDSGYTGPPSPQQMKSLADLSVYLHHQIPTIVRTIGHRDVAKLFYPTDPDDYSTACPGSELYKQLGALRAYIAGHLTSV